MRAPGPGGVRRWPAAPHGVRPEGTGDEAAPAAAAGARGRGRRRGHGQRDAGGATAASRRERREPADPRGGGLSRRAPVLAPAHGSRAHARRRGPAAGDRGRVRRHRGRGGADSHRRRHAGAARGLRPRGCGGLASAAVVGGAAEPTDPAASRRRGAPRAGAARDPRLVRPGSARRRGRDRRCLRPGVPHERACGRGGGPALFGGGAPRERDLARRVGALARGGR